MTINAQKIADTLNIPVDAPVTRTAPNTEERALMNLRYPYTSHDQPIQFAQNEGKALKTLKLTGKHQTKY